MEVEAVNGDRVAKRQKLTNGHSKAVRPRGTSRIFAPYRTVGLVSPTAVPFTSVPLGKTTFQITTSVGRSLQTYDLRRGLNLLFITRPKTPEIITASIAWKERLLAAWGGDAEAEGTTSTSGVWVFKRGKKEAELELPRGWREHVTSFCVFGSWIVGVCESRLLVWKSRTLELYTTLQGISPVALTNCIASLPTFLNKVIVGRQDGSAEIWNVSSGKLVYTVLPSSTAWGAVTAIAPTPALSLVAIAYEGGPLLLHDIQTDQTVLQLSGPAGAPITSITFRADGLGAGDDGRISGAMATASTSSGHVTLWDLNNGGRRAGVLHAAHAHPTVNSPGGVSKIDFLPAQAVLVSSGLDNSLKTWIFDEMPFSPIPRILHQRSGHGAFVTSLNFLPSASDGSDDTGKWLMSASRDRSLWGWSLRRDGQSTELSQGAVNKKAKKQGLLSSGSRDALGDLKCPPITSMACSLNRDGGIGALPGRHPIWQNAKGKQVSAEISAMTGWESVVTAHQNSSKARTWFWGRKRAGRWAFDTGDGGSVTSVAMSPCGTFAVVGSEKGGIDMFNLQSGMHRQRYPARLTPLQAKQLKFDTQKYALVEEDDGKKIFYRGQGKHGSAVVGLAVNGLNKTIVSAGADGKVKFWDFGTGLLSHEIDWSASTGISGMRFHSGTDLAALYCTDGCIRVVDISTSKLIRELWPSRPPVPELDRRAVSDFAISSDARWIAAAMGQVVLVWDLPTGHLVDAFKLTSECTSLAFSPTGEFLATATKDSVGVDIWSNRSLFMHVATRLISATDLSKITAADNTQAPTASDENGQSLLATNEVEDVDLDLDIDLAVEPTDIDQISSNLLSLSLVPRSRWQNLLHLDAIRQRNKPIEPPKQPEKAPFFLPSLQDRQSGPGAAKPVVPPPAAADEGQESTRIARFSSHTDRANELADLLHAASSSSSDAAFAAITTHLSALPPSAADLAIRSLSPTPSFTSSSSSDDSEAVTFVRTLIWLLRQRRDFELGQAWMAVFLRVHGDAVVADEGLRTTVREWAEASKGEVERVRGLGGYCSGVVGWAGRGRV